ncbi:lipoprotein-anchoring transpeptidase ErfK/SrfK [Hoeflea halophila]|uniref:Lipoprotein-anchoring transpeptidase ErfK/SrfK n=1 Tax=Hoeflea halophila TaxID=714899 RepID=A0A286I591_9HYPH|nr:L,D-transpeptidase [Hoeflea halophila]SOE15268.1 lipoprotein-anchoring transpeptidase ErfK/SrfK [Hoeflea halophila]
MDTIQIMLAIAAATFAAVVTFGKAQAAAMDPAAINAATFTGEQLPDGQSPLAVRLQILLDRAGASPGVIDGYSGENVEKAIRGFEQVNGIEADGLMDPLVWDTLQAMGDDVIVSYTITAEDTSGLSAELPEDYSELAKLEWLGFTSVREKLAERFHMDEDFLSDLNPGAQFTAGESIFVADPGANQKAEVASLVADKSQARLLAYDASKTLIGIYPVTIGSSSTPSPSGTHTVEAVAMDPTYSYDPETNFVQGDNTQPLTLPPGPNGPVGNVWIDLSEPTYGIHGTPHPSKIDKTSSHGCVRMTNWDAQELAHMVSQGVTVEFRD